MAARRPCPTDVLIQAYMTHDHAAEVETGMRTMWGKV